MPTEKSKQEARRVALTRITNPEVRYVELDITSNKITLVATTYDGEEQIFEWKC